MLTKEGGYWLTGYSHGPKISGGHIELRIFCTSFYCKQERNNAF